MAAITHVFTLARVAEMLGEDQDWLDAISDELEPEDGMIAVYGTGEECTPVFTAFGIVTCSHRSLTDVESPGLLILPSAPSRW